jgi:hypothetical protein
MINSDAAGTSLPAASPGCADPPLPAGATYPGASRANPAVASGRVDISAASFGWAQWLKART